MKCDGELAEVGGLLGVVKRQKIKLIGVKT